MSLTDTADLIIQALPIPAFVILPDARIASANDPATALLGRQILNRHYVTALRQPDILETIERSARDGVGTECDYVVSTQTVETRYRVSARPVGPGGRLGTLVCFEDVSHLHVAGQMRRDFVANVSHELRTPLTAMMGFIETLRGPARNDTAAQARFLGLMQQEAKRMNRLVGDLLSLSRVEAVERQRPDTPVRLADVLSASVSSLSPQAEAAQVELRADLPEAEVLVPGDADQLRQVFNNLLENAIKYGGQGGLARVVIRAPAQDASLRTQAVRIDVIDKGPGVDPFHLPRLTERFYRVDEHRSREMGGTGLGLAIVKHIVSRHRGRMEIDSVPGQGSRFSVILPVI